ncbi:MAG: YitT family protein [Bacilli bacterium]|nr:YitT family protein [Bacilli bacterium]
MEVFSRLDFEWLIDKVNKDNLTQRYCLFFFSVYLYALSFSLFFNPYNIVTGGSTGLSIIANRVFGINPVIFIFLFSLAIFMLGYVTLGKKIAIRSLIGVFILPIFIQAASVFTKYIDFENTSMLALMVYGGLLNGFANGLMIRTGFTTGGVQTLCQIMNKYFKISIGNANLGLNFLIILLGTFIFGIPNLLYALIALYISSIIMDKVILGISDSKAFYIITSKEEEVKEFIMSELGHSVTLLEARGGYTNKKMKVILCVMPTREYILAKDVISEIDDKAFYIITDAYEVGGGI